MSWKMSISLDIKNCILHMYEKETGDMIWSHFIKSKNIIGLGNRHYLDPWLGSAFEPTLGCLLGWDSLRPCNTSSLPHWDRTPASSPGPSSSPSASVGTLSCSRCWFCRQTNAYPLHRVAPHRRCGSGHTFPAELCSLYYKIVAGWSPVKGRLRCVCRIKNHIIKHSWSHVFSMYLFTMYSSWKICCYALFCRVIYERQPIKHLQVDKRVHLIM